MFILNSSGWRWQLATWVCGGETDCQLVRKSTGASGESKNEVGGYFQVGRSKF